MNGNTKYPNGYLSKVAYHVNNGNLEKAESFLESHIEKYGDLNSSDIISLMMMVKKES